MSDISLSASIRSNLLSLQQTTKLLDSTQNRLSTGRRVNSAIDDPTAFFAAQALNNRAGDLAARKDGIGLGISALESADKSLTSIGELVAQAKSLATQAQEASTQVTKLESNDISAAAADIGANLAGVADGDTFTIQVGDASAVTITVADGDTAAAIAAKIDAADSGINSTYNTDTGKIEITADAGTVVTIAEGTNTPAAGLGLTVGATTFGSTGSGNDVSKLETDFKAVMAQIDALRNDASYKGINLLNSDTLTIKFNEDGSSNLGVTGVDYDSEGLGFTAAASVDWSSAGNIDASITEAEAAAASIRSQQATFGTNLSIAKIREEFTVGMINSLEEGASKLVNADLNEEGANLLALQTRQALGTQALVFANQAQQSVLSLFR